MFFNDEIESIKQKGLLRIIRDKTAHSKLFKKDISSKNGENKSYETYVSSHLLIEGKEFLNFSSNDYLGLSSNRRIMEAAINAIDIYGFGAGASRLLSGGTDLHSKLEGMIAKFKGTESALVFNSGYTANTSVIPAIADEEDIIFSDELNHASIVDGCRLSRGKKVIYQHADMQHLSDIIKKERGKKKIIITDTVFSMDGDIAPLNELYEICQKNDAILYLDDAHGTGVLGNGKGALSHFGLEPQPWVIQMGTLSKALGSFGAFIAASSEIIQWLINKSRGLIFSTALPACIIAASIKAIEIISEDKLLIEKLWHNRERLFKGLIEIGYNTLKSQTPIIPLLPPPLFSSNEIENINKISEVLIENQIYAPAIRPPTVKTPRLRFSVIASHTDEDIDKLLNVVKNLR